MIEELLGWLRAHPDLMRAAVIAAIALSVSSLVLLPLLVTRMPADYFADEEPPQMPWQEAHPIWRFVLRVLRNGLGALLLLIGLAMLALPGQGILTILVALSLLEFPGKRRLEIALVRRKRFLAALNWLRRKTGKPPLTPPSA